MLGRENKDLVGVVSASYKALKSLYNNKILKDFREEIKEIIHYFNYILDVNTEDSVEYYLTIPESIINILNSKDTSFYDNIVARVNEVLTNKVLDCRDCRIFLEKEPNKWMGINEFSDFLRIKQNTSGLTIGSIGLKEIGNKYYFVINITPVVNNSKNRVLTYMAAFLFAYYTELIYHNNPENKIVQNKV